MKRKKKKSKAKRDRVFEEEGFTPREIAELPKNVRKAILEKYK